MPSVTFTNEKFNLGFGRNRSAVDRSEFEFVTGSFLFPLTYRMDLELSLGRSRSELFESSTYGGVMLIFYGGS